MNRANKIGWGVVLFCVAVSLAFVLASRTAHAEPLADRFTTLMMRTAHPGLSPHSFEILGACGSNPDAPDCDVTRPTCDAPTVLCRAPVFIAGAWRQVERSETAQERFREIARAVTAEAEALEMLTKGKAWPGGATDFAAAMLAASYWSTGFREDIESGRARGPAKEACLADLQPMVAWSFAPFPHENLSAEQVALQLVGSDSESLHRCYGTGLRALSSMRRWADLHCKHQPTQSYAGFAAYATGSKCETPRNGPHGDVAGVRETLYRKFLAAL